MLTAMAYVDLNPIRAKLAETPESSDHTAIAERLAELQGRAPPTPATTGASSDTNRGADTHEAVNLPEPADENNARPRLQKEQRLTALPRAPLMPFDATGRLATAVPFAFEDYLELVDGTGRVIREDKRGFIPGATPAILERLNIDAEQFIRTAGRTLHRFGSAIGTPEHLTQRCVSRNVAYLRGIQAARALFERCAAYRRKASLLRVEGLSSGIEAERYIRSHCQFGKQADARYRSGVTNSRRARASRVRVSRFLQMVIAEYPR